MASPLRRIPLRLAAIAAGIGLPLLTAGTVDANLPSANLPPIPALPSVPGGPQEGQPITLLVAPGLGVAPLPPPASGCFVYISFDNTQAREIIFRGQVACGSGVYGPTMTGHAVLKDTFSNVVASAAPFGPSWGDGPDTSQGSWSGTGSGVLADGLDSTGPVPGLDYTVAFDSSVTISWPQHWGPAATGCSVNGQTLVCHNTTTFTYVPGTKGGEQP